MSFNVHRGLFCFLITFILETNNEHVLICDTKALKLFPDRYLLFHVMYSHNETYSILWTAYLFTQRNTILAIASFSN